MPGLHTLNNCQIACAQGDGLFLQIVSTNRITFGTGTADDAECKLEIEAMEEYLGVCSKMNILDRIFQFDQ